MNRRDHYTILGISRGATPTGIRAAYLRLVKKLHPDRAGEHSTRAFREVQHAYDVLSDPVRRRRYDESLDRKRPARPRSTDPLTGARVVEPLVADAPDVRWPQADLAPLAVGRSTSPVHLDLVLSPVEAARGGELVVNLPIEARCGACGGAGFEWPFLCLDCLGRGTVVRQLPIAIRIPAGLRHRAVIDLHPEDTGGLPIRLFLRIGRMMRAPPLW